MILVTGSSGFVGRALCRRLEELVMDFRPVARQASRGAVCVGSIDADTDWTAALAGCHTVIHLAARVHMMNETARDPLAAFRRVNVDGALNLARQAVAHGVRRFIFLSSLKVNGESGACAVGDPAAPQDAYAVSKHEAEQALRALAAETGLELVVLRPPLVYGPGVAANFMRLLRTVERGIPLPLGRVENRRSLIFVGNLVDAIVLCAHHPSAVGRTFLPSDGDDVSTPELIRRIAQALGRSPRLLPVPVAVLRLGARLLGKQGASERVLASLYSVDRALQNDLGWRPPFSMKEGLRLTVAGLCLNNKVV